MTPYRKYWVGGEGFTFLEIIVVVTLISIMLFFSLPRFQEVLIPGDRDKTARWIIANVKALKERAVRDKRLYALHVGMDSRRLWFSDETMSEEKVQAAREDGHRIPSELRVMDVAYLGKGTVTTGRADIYFYPQGYSDKAVIRFRDSEDQDLSFVIEPFLSTVDYKEEYIQF